MKYVAILVIAAACVFAGTARAYEMDDKIGAEIVKIDAGDKGVYGAAKWLRDQKLLPMGMSVAEAYVKICRKNFDGLKECEEASLNFRPGQTLKIFAPVISRAAYTERVTEPFKKEIALLKDENLEARHEFIKARREQITAAALAKAAVAETKKANAEIEKLKQAKTELKEQNKILAEQNASRLAAAQRAMVLQALAIKDLKRDSAFGLRAEISGLMKSFDDFMERGGTLLSLDYGIVCQLLALACLVMILPLLRQERNARALSALVERIRGLPSDGNLLREDASLKTALANKYCTELPEFYEQGGRKFRVGVQDTTDGASKDYRLPKNLRGYLNGLDSSQKEVDLSLN